MEEREGQRAGEEGCRRCCCCFCCCCFSRFCSLSSSLSLSLSLSKSRRLPRPRRSTPPATSRTGPRRDALYNDAPAALAAAAATAERATARLSSSLSPLPHSPASASTMAQRPEFQNFGAPRSRVFRPFLRPSFALFFGTQRADTGLVAPVRSDARSRSRAGANGREKVEFEVSFQVGRGGTCSLLFQSRRPDDGEGLGSRESAPPPGSFQCVLLPFLSAETSEIFLPGSTVSEKSTRGTSSSGFDGRGAPR